MKLITAVLLTVLLVNSPAKAQQGSITCTPQQDGTTVCQQTPKVSAARIGIVLGAVAATVVVYAVIHRHHKKHVVRP